MTKENEMPEWVYAMTDDLIEEVFGQADETGGFNIDGGNLQHLVWEGIKKYNETLSQPLPVDRQEALKALDFCDSNPNDYSGQKYREDRDYMREKWLDTYEKTIRQALQAPQVDVPLAKEREEAYLETNDSGFVYIVINGKRVASLFGNLETKHRLGNEIISALSKPNDTNSQVCKCSDVKNIQNNPNAVDDLSQPSHLKSIPTKTVYSTSQTHSRRISDGQ